MVASSRVFRRHVESGRQSLEPMSAGNSHIAVMRLDVKLSQQQFLRLTSQFLPLMNSPSIVGGTSRPSQNCSICGGRRLFAEFLDLVDQQRIRLTDDLVVLANIVNPRKHMSHGVEAGAFLVI